MTPFLRPTEVALMRHDYENLVKSQDACEVTLEYLTFADPLAPPDIDPVYKTDRRISSAIKKTVPKVRCIQQVVNVGDVKFLATQIVTVGDCIFYFSNKQNLLEPLEGFPLVQDSLVVVDPSKTRWVPKLPYPGPLPASLVLRVGNSQIGQPMPCRIEK